MCRLGAVHDDPNAEFFPLQAMGFYVALDQVSRLSGCAGQGPRLPAKDR